MEDDDPLPDRYSTDSKPTDSLLESNFPPPEFEELPRSSKNSLSNATRCLWMFISILLLTVLFEGLYITYLLRQIKHLKSHLISSKHTAERTVHSPSIYTSLNETESNQAWDAILPGLGVVAVEEEYATAHNLPDTVEMPGGDGKLLYVIEAYHAIHCVKILRSHYLALRADTPWEWSHGHDMHCFDTLRQYIMCNPDDTLLYTTGHRDAGHGQKKICRDWDALRDWAESHNSGYFDTEPGSGVNNWGIYHKGDGLPMGSLLGWIVVT
ncbi:hypothetical protein G7Y89_g335 [Cudoniella acicularis]|uniref:Uncharacterized protein n=1 Tax=Cudoniella acicularis TaxID=354080 RepID=A0A8H4S027_9HELO|nr:hypothetical protein G7Y89_g335 [Cudoniella acicularis]